MSYERMKKREAELKAEVARMLRPPSGGYPGGRDFRQRQARRRDAGLAGDKQKRLAKIQQAMQRWRPTPGCGGGRASHRAEKEQQRQAEGRKKPGKPRRRHRPT